MTQLNPASLEWKIAFDLGYWRAVYINDVREWSDIPRIADQARYRSAAVVDLARRAVAGMSRAKRRAFGAAVKSSFQSTLEWKRNLSAA